MLCVFVCAAHVDINFEMTNDCWLVERFVSTFHCMVMYGLGVYIYIEREREELRAELSGS